MNIRAALRYIQECIRHGKLIQHTKATKLHTYLNVHTQRKQSGKPLHPTRATCRHFIGYTSQERPVATVRCPKPTHPSQAVLLLEKICDLELFHDSPGGSPLGDGRRRGGRTGAPLGDGRSRGGRTSQGPPHQLVGPHQIVHVHDEAGWLVLHNVEIQLMAAHPVHLQQVAAEPLCSVKEAIVGCIRHTSHKYSKVGCTIHGWTV
jgi:hypothetical protein